MKIFFIALSAIVVCVLVLLLMLTRHGLRDYTVTDWESPSREPAGWDEVFSNSRHMELHTFSMGISRTQPGARPYLRPESIPEDYNIDTVATPPTLSFAVEHPQMGCILIDAGLNKSYFNGDGGDSPLLMKIYQKLSRYEYEVTETENIAYYLDRYNLDPTHVLITHMHPDHVAGLSEIPEDVPAVFGKKENSFFYKMISGSYMKTRNKLQTLDFTQSNPLGPFSRVIDLFGDQSVLAISSPGHTADHISYFVNDSENPALIIGDLTISEDFFTRGIESSVDSKDSGHMQLTQSLKELGDFIALYPQVKIYYSHSYPEEALRR